MPQEPALEKRLSHQQNSSIPRGTVIFFAVRLPRRTVFKEQEESITMEQYQQMGWFAGLKNEVGPMSLTWLALRIQTKPSEAECY